MRPFQNALACSLLVMIMSALGARSSAQTADSNSSTAIHALLERQAVDWNRGDLDAFAAGYKDSPDILFIGPAVAHGYAGMLASYRKHYPSRTSMGTLSFSQLEVQPLDERFATSTGHYHLERTAEGGGNADGYFLLVLEKTGAGWKIIRDDTATTTPKR